MPDRIKPTPYRYYKEQVQGFSPFTPAVHAAFALQEALRELEDQGGWRARNARYWALASAIRDTLSDLGVESLLNGAVYSSMISSFHLPEGLTYGRLHDCMREAGFMIYAGQGGVE
jgi:2-aminoethylphosphonate-pyruvate transaminase